MIKFIKRLMVLAFWGVVAVLLSLVITDKLVKRMTKNVVYDATKSIPHNKVGLLLGTSKMLANGRVNLYYSYRINAAVELFKAGKIDFILVSGDNGSKSYDEPTTFKNDLIAKGVPSNKIYLDYAGFRTLDSVVRSKAIFGQKSITIISQRFHNERAICIAKWKGIKAVGYNAKDVSRRYGIKIQLREKFARVKMLLDLIFGKQPKFFGKKIKVQ